MNQRVKLLQLAIENQRWDLAAHALVFSTLKVKTDLQNAAKPQRFARICGETAKKEQQ